MQIIWEARKSGKVSFGINIISVINLPVFPKDPVFIITLYVYYKVYKLKLWGIKGERFHDLFYIPNLLKTI